MSNEIPLTVQTLIADLDQKLDAVTVMPGSITSRMVNGIAYLYSVERHGTTRLQRYLGPASNRALDPEVKAIVAASVQARIRRQQVSLIKKAGVPGPSRPIGQLMEAISRAGFFDTGLVLIGTVAFGTYSALLGFKFEDALMSTQDADFAVASIADTRGDADILEVIRRADKTFRPVPTLDARDLPRKFHADSGLEVELLTPTRNRHDKEAIAVPGMGASARSMQYMAFLLEDAVPALMLHNDGIRVRVPQPMRYCIHKLIISQDPQRTLFKKTKDLQQAKQLFGFFAHNDPDGLADLLMATADAGPKWRTHLARGLHAIGEDPEIIGGGSVGNERHDATE
jgi:hypothetical protein